MKSSTPGTDIFLLYPKWEIHELLVCYIRSVGSTEEIKYQINQIL